MRGIEGQEDFWFLYVGIRGKVEQEAPIGFFRQACRDAGGWQPGVEPVQEDMIKGEGACMLAARAHACKATQVQDGKSLALKNEAHEASKKCGQIWERLPPPLPQYWSPEARKGWKGWG